MRFVAFALFVFCCIIEILYTSIKRPHHAMLHLCPFSLHPRIAISSFPFLVPTPSLPRILPSLLSILAVVYSLIFFPATTNLPKLFACTNACSGGSSSISSRITSCLIIPIRPLLLIPCPTIMTQGECFFLLFPQGSLRCSSWSASNSSRA